MANTRLSLMGTPGVQSSSCLAPYLDFASGSPAIVGIIQRGQRIEIDVSAANWFTDDNGPIHYHVDLYSYSNTSGADERLEKDTNSRKPLIPIILKGPNIVGRYLRAKVTAFDNCGYDPTEIYWTGYSAIVANGTDPTTTTYNSLFGKGVHLEDDSLEGYWLLQDDAADTVVLDDTLNQRHGTLNGGDNTETLSVDTGPNSWLAKAFKFNGVDDWVSLIDQGWPTGDDAQTFSIWWNRNTAGYAFGTNATGPIYCYTSGGSQFFKIGSGPALDFSDNTNEWHFGSIVSVGGTGGGLNLYVDGNTTSHASTTTTQGNSANLTIGALNAGASDFWDGRVAGISNFSRALANSETAQIYYGPEPICNLNPVLTQPTAYRLISDTGIWDSQNNGPITYSYEWFRADDTNGTNEVSTGTTTSTYLTVAADLNKYLRCKVRGTNDGGFDPAEDSYTEYSSQITVTTSPLSKTTVVNVSSVLDVTNSDTLPVSNLLSVLYSPVFNAESTSRLLSTRDLVADSLLEISSLKVLNSSSSQSLQISSEFPVLYHQSVTTIFDSIPISNLASVSIQRDLNGSFIGNIQILKELNISSKQELQTTQQIPVVNLLSVSSQFDFTISNIQNIRIIGDIPVESLLNVSFLKDILIDTNITFDAITSQYIWTLPSRQSDWVFENRDADWIFSDRDKNWSFTPRQRIWCIINRNRIWTHTKKK